MTHSWLELYDLACSQLKHLEDNVAISKRLIEEMSGMSLTKIRLKEIQPNPQQEKEFNITLKRLQTGEPLQYVLGYEYFLGMKLNVNSSVLIPRPETEELVLLTKKLFNNTQPSKAIDFCTGSGCIALGLKNIFPQATIWATDISKKALSTALTNALQNFGTNHAIKFIEHDLLNQAQLPHEPLFDLIVSNPPYITREETSTISPNVLEFEPHLALFAEGDDSLIYYRALLLMAKKNLASQGKMICEINPMYATSLQHIGDEAQFHSEIIQDIIGKNRFWLIKHKV
ncbi:MAG: peptide chain release factor N(5)-glutamine methyltransferase [Bacteroidia bacterium]|nr:peptide chain release factor N(5)-glutamine methyltransferase [Bacteroidia bacterium]